MGKQINLIQGEESFAANLLKLLDDPAVIFQRFLLRTIYLAFALRDPGRSVDQVHNGVRIVSAAPGRLDHGAVEPALGRKDTRSVHKHDLRAVHLRDAAHREARRLHLVRDDCHLSADQTIGQRGLARIRRADNGGKSSMGDGGVCHGVPVRLSRRRAAALRSASRFDDPAATAAPRSATLTSTS